MNEVFEFDNRHHFFDQILAFAVVLTGACSVIRSVQLKAMLDALNKGQDPGFGGLIVGGQGAGSILVNLLEIAESIQLKKLVSRIQFEENPFHTSGAQYPAEGELPFGPVLESAARVCLGSAYESVGPSLRKTFGADFGKWPPVLQYFRHLRNAASHGNHFDIRPRRKVPGKKRQPAIDPKDRPTWRTSVMPDDASMRGKLPFDEFLRHGDVPVLLCDIDLFLLGKGIAPDD